MRNNALVQNEQHLFVDLRGQVQTQKCEPAACERSTMELQWLDLLIDQICFFSLFFLFLLAFSLLVVTARTVSLVVAGLCCLLVRKVKTVKIKRVLVKIIVLLHLIFKVDAYNTLDQMCKVAHPGDSLTYQEEAQRSF
jgi:hypothetical protein